MDIKKCVSGHYFDADTYSLCPQCGSEVSSKSMQDKSIRKKSYGLFRKRQKKAANIMPVAIDEGNDKLFNESYINKTEAYDTKADRESFEPTGIKKKDENKMITYDVWNNTTFNEISITGDTTDTGTGKEDKEDIDEKHDMEKTSDVSKNQDNRKMQESDEAESESLKAALKKVSSSTEGKTFGYFSFNRNVPQDNAYTDSENPHLTGMQVDTQNNGGFWEKQQTEPVVGWLVCIKGPHIGECFHIFAGRNSIGRNGDNHIVLFRDNHVSRQKHALITYEPRKREFFIQPGDSNGLTYYNGENILESRKMKSKDEIEIGESILKLFPLCDEDFSWEDYLNRD